MAAYNVGYMSGTPEASTCAATTAKVMVDDDVLFNVYGHVIIRSIVSECVTDNNATASTLQYKVTPDVGTETTVSGASASLANATAGTMVVLSGAGLADAPSVNANGAALNTTARGIQIHIGTIGVNIGVGSTTGTWRHHIRYDKLTQDGYIAPAF